MSTEGDVSKNMLLQVGKEAPETRLFRNNTGMAWQGDVRFKDAHTLVLANYRPIHMGLIQGSSDYIGWTEKTITDDMVGQKVAVFTAVEMKKPGGKSATDKQMNFIARIKGAGGLAGIARNGDDAVQIIKNP